MHITHADPTRHDPSRTGARWVAGTGAFLLFAAAVVFVAVRWGEIPDGAKLAALAGLTGALVIGGRSSRLALPATSTALFHLGLFLIPVNVAAAMLRTDLGADWIVLLAAGTGLVGFVTGARLERSALLRAGAVGAASVAAGALAAVLPVPSPVVGVAATTVLSLGLAHAAVGINARHRLLATLVALAALVPPVVAAIDNAGDVATAVSVSGLMVTAWVLALVLDRAELGNLVRVASLGLLPAGLAVGTPDQISVVVGAFGALALIDALRREEPELALGTSLAAPVAIFTGLLAIDLEPASAGIGLTVAAVVPAGLIAVVPPRWRPPLVTGTIIGATWGVATAHLDPASGATALLVAGALLAVTGATTGQPIAAFAGFAVLSVGYWSHLGLADIESSDAFVAPVAAALVAAGVVARSGKPNPISSWIAYAPAVVLLGGAGLIERVDGGDEVHALVAGAVGLTAVLFGGRRRLLGPLVTGTVLLVALTVHETLAVTAGVPTWGWLALGGSALLGAGIAMDRADTGPIEAGRNVVEVLGERFS